MVLSTRQELRRIENKLRARAAHSRGFNTDKRRHQKPIPARRYRKSHSGGGKIGRFALDDRDDGRQLAADHTVGLPGERNSCTLRRTPTLERQEAFKAPRSWSAEDTDIVVDDADLYRLGLLYDDDDNNRDDEHFQKCQFQYADSCLDTIPASLQPSYWYSIRPSKRAKMSHRRVDIRERDVHLSIELLSACLTDDADLARYLVPLATADDDTRWRDDELRLNLHMVDRSEADERAPGGPLVVATDRDTDLASSTGLDRPASSTPSAASPPCRARQIRFACPPYGSDESESEAEPESEWRRKIVYRYPEYRSSEEEDNDSDYDDADFDLLHDDWALVTHSPTDEADPCHDPHHDIHSTKGSVEAETGDDVLLLLAGEDGAVDAGDVVLEKNELEIAATASTTATPAFSNAADDAWIVLAGDDS